MTDNQGRGNNLDESRIERHTSRPTENPSGGSSSGGSTTSFPNTADQVHRILNPSNNSSGSASMQSAQNLAYQLEWCVNSRHHLESLEDELRRIARLYIQTVEELAGDQYMGELLQRLIPLRDEFSNRAQATCQHIQDAHIEYVNQQADSVSSQLEIISSLPNLV